MVSCFRAIATALVFTVYAATSQAESISHFGDFEDFFDSASYLSSDPSDPGASFLLDAPIIGIPKFDGSLGTLTDIILTIEESVVMVSLDGSITVSQDDEAFDFGSTAAIGGELGVFYIKETPTITTLETFLPDMFSVDGGCGGGPGDGGCSDSAFAGTFSGDEFIAGEESIIGAVLLDDFVGTGDIELSIGLLVPISADFGAPENIEFAELEFSFDVFDGITGVAGETVGVTYVYSPVPIPAAWLMFLPAAWMTMRKKRRG